MALAAIAFARAVLARAAERTRRDWRAFALCVAVSFIPTAIADLTLDEMTALRATGPISLIELYLSLQLTFRTLAAEGAAPPGYDRRRPTEGRFPAAFLLSLLSGIAVLAGLLLLFIPGALLFLLWSVALPALAAERLSVVDALKRSWALTRPALGRVAALAAAFVLAVAALILPPMLTLGYGPDADDIVTVATDLGISMTLMFSPIAWTYAYLALRRDPA